ncbi:MAG: Cas10/Cmr2 second palm domain-containing protein, partial [Gemmataceae bacterium]
DVLAFVPVDKCLDCARDLHDDFGTKLVKYSSKQPTLSVGIAIGHFMDNLEDLLEYGRAAEKAAKKVEGKDALAVHLHKRGGSPTEVQSQWTDGIDKRLQQYAKLILLEAIPGKLPYDLRKLAEHYDGWKQVTVEEKLLVKAAMRRDVIRVIRDKQPRSGREHMPEIERIVNSIETPKALKQFTEVLLVAKQIATALSQAGGKS